MVDDGCRDEIKRGTRDREVCDGRTRAGKVGTGMQSRAPSSAFLPRGGAEWRGGFVEERVPGPEISQAKVMNKWHSVASALLLEPTLLAK
jgi:hypothetical protein